MLQTLLVSVTRQHLNRMESKFVEKARLELGETDLKKAQALVHFREWLSKHRYFKNARQGKLKQ